MPPNNQGMGGLGNIFQWAQKSLSQRPVYNEKGEKIGTVPSRGEPARLYSETATGYQLSTDFMNRMKQDMINKGKKAIVENAVQSGLVSPEDAQAVASNIPPGLIDMGIQQTGYGKGLQELEQFMKQQGYRDPSLVSNISGKRAQMQRNQKLQALAKGIKDYALDPELGDNPITGIRPEIYIQKLRQNPELVSDVIDSYNFQQQGEITPQGMQELGSRLENISLGIREAQNLTGVSDTQQALKQTQKILNTSNPVRTLSDSNTRQSLEQFRANAQAAGYTGGDMYGLLNHMTQLADKKGLDTPTALNKANAGLGYFKEQGQFDDPGQKRQYYKNIMTSVMDPEEQNSSKYEAAAKARLNMMGFGDEAAENTISSIVDEYDTTRPEDLITKINQRYYPDQAPLSLKNMKKFLETPEAEEYYSSETASRNAVKWQQKKGQYYQNQFLTNEFGQNTADQMKMYTGNNGFLSENDVQQLGQIGGNMNPSKRLDLQTRLRNVRQQVAEKMGIQDPDTAQRVTEARRPGRLEGAYEGWQKLTDELPKEREGYGPNRFLRQSLQGKKPVSNLYETMTGKKQDLRRS